MRYLKFLMNRVLSGKKVAERNLIEISAYFDAPFYRATYESLLTSEQDPLDHYIDIGDSLGLLPSDKFDPALYRFVHPQMGAGNSLVQYLLSGSLDSYRNVSEHFQEFKYIKGMPFPQLDLPQDVEERHRYHKQRKHNAREFLDTIQEELLLDVVCRDHEYQWKTPKASFFLDQIRDNRPFALGRVPHGFIDSLRFIMQLERQYLGDATDLTCQARFLLICRLCNEQIRGNGNFVEYFASDLLDLIVADNVGGNFFNSVAIAGAPGWEELTDEFRDRLSSHDEASDQSRTREWKEIVTCLFSDNDVIYDATCWKRWLITGSLASLPNVCRGHPLIIIGPETLFDLGKRWQHDDFTHIVIPAARTQQLRHEFLETLRKSLHSATAQTNLTDGKPAPIVLFQCGGSLAYWFMARLSQELPDVFFIDMGQALNAWFYDDKRMRRGVWNDWYMHAIIERNGLEDYYRDLMGSAFETEILSLDRS